MEFYFNFKILEIYERKTKAASYENRVQFSPQNNSVAMVSTILTEHFNINKPHLNREFLAITISVQNTKFNTTLKIHHKTTNSQKKIKKNCKKKFSEFLNFKIVYQ